MRPIRIRAAMLAALFATPMLPALALAAAEVHFTWTSCDEHVHNLPAAGQTEVRQVVSATGLSGNPGSFVLGVSLGRSYLWGLDSPWLCALGDVTPGGGTPLSGVVPATAGACPVVPGLQVSAQVNGCVTPDGCLSTFTVYGSFPDGTNLDPLETYALVEFVYDLTRIGAPGGPCPDEAMPSESCFGLIGASLPDNANVPRPEWLLSWNRADGDADACADAVPTRSETWGQIKLLYR